VSGATSARALADFVVRPRSVPLPPVALLERTQLAAFAFTQLPPGHEARAALEPAFLTAVTAHATARAALVTLLRAWHEAGVEALAFKGFALAEFTYDLPPQRYFDDADLLIRPADAALAEERARALGWHVRYVGVRGRHALMHLRSPDGRLDVDVHGLVLHSVSVRLQRLQRRFTAAAWAASRVRDLDGVPVRELDPRDAFVIGLALHRCWPDGWRLKARDYLDAAAIVRSSDVTREALLARARDLRCTGTVRHFLARCDPFRQHFDLRPPGRARRWWWYARFAHERVPYPLENLVARGPGMLLATLRELPGVLRVLWWLRREPDLTRLLPAVAPAALRRGPRSLDDGVRFRVVRGVHWSLRLLRVRPDGPCVPRALAVFAALRARGAPAVFCSGVRRRGAVLEGHAWVELDGEPVTELHEPMGARYVVNLRYPQDVPEHVVGTDRPVP